MKKIAIIGMGDMGIKYAEMILNNDLGFLLVASTRVKDFRYDKIKDKLISSFKIYQSDSELFKAIDKKELLVDAVLIATPHYNHVIATREALKRNLYVLCDKPLGVFLEDGRRLLEFENSRTNIAYIYQHREYNIDKYLFDIVKEKKYGDIKRINYIVTDWYRPNDYYKKSIWRSTYKSDGGGTILNQCPHNLDLLCHLFGLPKMVMSFNKNGKYHDIEVEDESTSYLEWENFTGIFIASTGETPGVNRLEISFSKALVVVLKNEIQIYENELYEEEYRKKDYANFKQPQSKFFRKEFKINKEEAYKNIIKNFYDVITLGKKPVASLDDAIKCQYLCNAIYLSGFKQQMLNIYKLGSKEEIEFEKEFTIEMNKRM